MKKFEYVWFIEGPENKTWQGEIKKMGKLGWECISVTPHRWSGGSPDGIGGVNGSYILECQYFFKREIE
ncbi:hypothetical protein OAO81_03295 [Candidatus Pelagibacter ubique]|jgi:hypothetical protein|nr:hypothetical protein [Candidatus Pelagibacter ubique]